MAESADPLPRLPVDVAGSMGKVDALLRSSVEASEPLVRAAVGHLLAAGGKRVRPMLVLLAGHLGDPDDPRIVDCAAAVELTHLATLYHDDVMDEAVLRRGAASANARFDNHVAILAGDWLFARSASIAAELGTYVSRTLARTIEAVCEGQIMESEIAGRPDQTAERHLEVIRRKTAALLAAATHLGAWLAGAPPGAVAAATSYGEALGMAFQLSDDVLDVVGVEQESGKVPGTDLREGVWTMPVLETMAGRAPRGEELRAALAAGDIEAALAVLKSNGSVELARAAVGEWASRAKQALAPLEPSDARQALERLADFVVERSR
jgi:heptaprenyl diphosphate synthase